MTLPLIVAHALETPFENYGFNISPIFIRSIYRTIYSADAILLLTGLEHLLLSRSSLFLYLRAMSIPSCRSSQHWPNRHERIWHEQT